MARETITKFAASNLKFIDAAIAKTVAELGDELGISITVLPGGTFDSKFATTSATLAEKKDAGVQS
jgi:hypothetical protein